ncbi:unnamed protein product [Parnassius mnemosyne]|uniref:Reverse transcriptase domain-containing protein n=1 Tax=Parnassius mnemosyne TaxID=213953 RepID=A0AAV1KHP5_9NEOP
MVRITDSGHLRRRIYKGTMSCRNQRNDEKNQEFQVKVGVHQGSALSPLLFNLVMNYLTAQIQQPAPCSISYADDVVLIDENPLTLQATLEKWRSSLENAGLKICRKKTEHFPNSTATTCTTNLQGSTLRTAEHFKYLGSGIDANITHHINTGWQKWRVLTGVLCDTRVPIRVKGKVYKTAVRPVMTYGVECWPVKKQQANKMHVADMRVLKWSAGVTMLDKVQNQYIPNSFKIQSKTNTTQAHGVMPSLVRPRHEKT